VVNCIPVLQASDLQALQDRLDSQVAVAKQAEDNAREAERKAAEQATIAAAARAEVRCAAQIFQQCRWPVASSSNNGSLPVSPPCSSGHHAAQC
jgi:hypothetical protein